MKQKSKEGWWGGQPQSGEAILGHKDWQCGVSEANTALPILNISFDVYAINSKISKFNRIKVLRVCRKVVNRNG